MCYTYSMLLIWDEPKRSQNLAKHGMDFADLDPELFATATVSPGKVGRSLAIGEFRDRMVIAVVFVLLGSEAISIVSMRPASRRERRSR